MKSEKTTTERGREAEDLALAFLRKNGLALVARNYRCKGGEIDLVMRDGGVIVFVEVRLRGRLAEAAESISRTKRRRLALTGRNFLLREIGPAGEALETRFDAALVDGEKKIRWLRDTMRLDEDEGW